MKSQLRFNKRKCTYLTYCGVRIFEKNNFLLPCKNSGKLSLRFTEDEFRNELQILLLLSAGTDLEKSAFSSLMMKKLQFQTIPFKKWLISPDQMDAIKMQIARLPWKLKLCRRYHRYHCLSWNLKPHALEWRAFEQVILWHRVKDWSRAHIPHKRWWCARDVSLTYHSKKNLH